MSVSWSCTASSRKGVLHDAGPLHREAQGRRVPQAEGRPAENLTQLQAANALVSGLSARGMGAALVRQLRYIPNGKKTASVEHRSTGEGRKKEQNSQDHLEQDTPG